LFNKNETLAAIKDILWALNTPNEQISASNNAEGAYTALPYPWLDLGFEWLLRVEGKKEKGKMGREKEQNGKGEGSGENNP